ncbi:MAG TPA: MerR family transcriptional regulator [Thermoleophilaceae bacterium]|nr:MerR family transcriptional regulator [Thermoleophilaceae bacterium]
MAQDVEHSLRIGELSRRVGVSPELLRAWERRYGLLHPVRTKGGLRLYSAEDERRVRAMQAHLDGGLSAAEAARLASAGDFAARAAEHGDAIQRGVAELREALDAMDADTAHAVLDGLLATFTLETVLSGVVLPYLRELGERWQRSEASVAQEHFASNLLRARLLALARGWERGEGATALLACAPREQHDLPLVAFGLALRGRGWRIVFLGTDTPAASIAETAERLRPALVVVSSVTPRSFRREADALAAIAREHRLVIAGAGADERLAQSLGSSLLQGDPVAAAGAV